MTTFSDLISVTGFTGAGAAPRLPDLLANLRSAVALESIPGADVAPSVVRTGIRQTVREPSLPSRRTWTEMRWSGGVSLTARFGEERPRLVHLTLRAVACCWAQGAGTMAWMALNEAAQEGDVAGLGQTAADETR
jgi:hypothetical protein